MPKVDVRNQKGEVTGSVELSDGIFGVGVNEVAVKYAVLSMLANGRQGTHSTKTKSEVSGGGRKPYRQKGTGRARHGSTRSAQWIKGGIVHGPKPRSYRFTIPKKVRRLALKSALTARCAEDAIVVLDELRLDAVRTKSMVALLRDLNVGPSALIVIGGKDEAITLSARNIPGIKTAYTNTINVHDILKYGKIIMTKDALAKVEEVYA
ncbi:MAG: 50S ribosomal protein L4 [Oscillospiraceae bacterium]|nr:50S ribosomal protein L4 [Oscillospiraceae bacterium]